MGILLIIFGEDGGGGCGREEGEYFGKGSVYFFGMCSVVVVYVYNFGVYLY